MRYCAKMVKSVFLLFFSVLLYNTQARVLKGNGGIGAACEMGGGVAGTCMDVAKCLNDGGEHKREGEIQLCRERQPGSDVILVCCRNSTPIAEELCETWSKYWRGGEHGGLNGACVQENQLIVGGENAELGEFPHVALVGRGTPESAFGIDWNCGGVLISPHFVLSAAHCFNCKPSQENCDTWVRLGGHDQMHVDKSLIARVEGPIPTILYQSDALKGDERREGLKEQEIQARRVIKHPEYNQNVHYWDIALIELQTPAMFTTRVLPACLPFDLMEDYINETITVSGWGYTQEEGVTEIYNPVLQKVDLNVTELLYCAVEYQTFDSLPLGIMPEHMCAGYDQEGMDSCQGDSGGPAVLRLPGGPGGTLCEHTLLGLVSFGQKCGETGIYTRVASYLDWILGYVAPNPPGPKIDVRIRPRP